MKTTPFYDTLIIGGSYAGLSAAMALGRSLRQVLIIDSGQPCNRQTPHSHNFLTQDGAKPGRITKTAREQVLAYPSVELMEDRVVQASTNEMGFEVRTQSDRIFYAKKLLLAFGIKDDLSEIPGLAECWGISVIHCPYCHGYEVRGKKTGIWAKETHAFHLASLVANLTDQVQLIPKEKFEFTDEQKEKLERNSIGILDKKLAEIRHENGIMSQVVFTDGSTEAFDALYAEVPFSLPDNIVQSLGCELADSGRIQVDQFLQTSVPGVYACGDCVSPMRSVAAAVASGNLTGGMINHMISTEEF